MYTFLTPPEYIGIPCQQEEFDLNLLAEKLEKGQDSDKHQLQHLERNPLIRKIAAPADVMDIVEIIHQYCRLWTLYAKTSIELKRTSKLPQEDTVTACKMYGTYISDVLKQFDEVMKLFAMENELRIINRRELLPNPTISPQESKIENKKDKDKILREVDAAREIELNYKKEKEAKNKEQQARLARQTNRPDLNASTVNASTPIRNTNTASQTSTNHHQQTEVAVHFDPNPVGHLYPTTNPTS